MPKYGKTYNAEWPEFVPHDPNNYGCYSVGTPDPSYSISPHNCAACHEPLLYQQTGSHAVTLCGVIVGGSIPVRGPMLGESYYHNRCVPSGDQHK